MKQHTLLPTQKKFITLDHDLSLDISVYQGGFGSGKTYAGALLGVMLCLNYPGIKGLVVAETFPKIRDTTLEKWREHLEAGGFQEWKHWTYNKTDQILRFKNGSTVYFRHCAEPEKMRSLEVGFIEIEEASDIKERTFLELLGRLRQIELKNGNKLPRRRLFCHTNPEASKGWIWKYFVEQTKTTISYSDTTEDFEVQGHTGKTRYIKKIVEETIEGKKVQVCYRLVLAPTIQNFHNPDSYIANMKATFDPEMYRIMVMGEFGDYTSGLVTKGFNKTKQLVPLSFNPEYPLHLTCDFNYDPNCWFVAQVYDNNVYFLDEIVLEHSDTEQSIVEFMRRYPVSGYPEIIINGDASGGAKTTVGIRGDNYSIMINYLKNSGYRVSPRPNIPTKNPDKILRIMAWNSKMLDSNGEHSIFFNARYDESGEFVTTVPRLLHSIENLKFAPGTNVILEPSRTELRRDPNCKFDTHVFDGASYIIWYYFPICLDKQPTVEVGQVRLRDSRFNLTGDDLGYTFDDTEY